MVPSKMIEKSFLHFKLPCRTVCVCEWTAGLLFRLVEQWVLDGGGGLLEYGVGVGGELDLLALPLEPGKLGMVTIKFISAN